MLTKRGSPVTIHYRVNRAASTLVSDISLGADNS
jgi:hypothetical protein